MTVKKIGEPYFQAFSMKRNSQKESSHAFPHNFRAQSEEDADSANLEIPEATLLSNSFQVDHESCLEACFVTAFKPFISYQIIHMPGLNRKSTGMWKDDPILPKISQNTCCIQLISSPEKLL